MDVLRDFDHSDVARFESVEAVDCRLKSWDRLGKVVLAIVPGDHIDHEDDNTRSDEDGDDDDDDDDDTDVIT